MSTGEIISLACTVGMFLATAYLAFAKKSQRREVSFDPGVATKEELTSHMTDCKSDRVEIWRQVTINKDQTLANQSQRNARLYEEIKQLRLDMNNADDATRAQMTSGFQDIERAIGRIEGKLEGR